MKSNSINLRNIPLSVIFASEVLLLAILYWCYGSAVSVFAGLILIAPTLFIIVKPYYPPITIPLPMALISVGFLAEIGTGLLRGYVGTRESTLYGFIALLITAFLFIKSNREGMKPYLTVLYLSAGVSIIQLPFRMIFFISTLVTLPDYLFHLLGVIAGFSLYYREKTVHKVIFVTSVILVLYAYFYGYNAWLNKLIVDI